MLLKVFTILDTKVPVYNKPFFMRSRGEALRQLESEMRTKQGSLYEHAEDFILFELGTFDEDTCKFDLHDAAQSVMRMIDIKSKLDLTSS